MVCRRVVLAVAVATFTSVGPPLALAISPRTGVTQLMVDTWTTDDGLPQDRVQAIAQTGDGLLWVGTEAGMARFDGQRFVTFAPPSLPDLRKESITELFGARDGSLWIGTRSGLVVHVSGGHATPLNSPDGQIAGPVWDVVEDEQGSPWVATSAGVYRVDGNRLVAVTTAAGPVYALARTPTGGWWFGGRRGLFRWEAGTLRPFTAKDGFTWGRISSLRAGQDGTLWMALRSEGLVSYKDGYWRTYGHGPNAIGRLARAVLVDRDGQTWVGTWNGLARVEGDRFSDWLTAAGRIPTAIDALFEDREGAVWVGTIGGGLFRVRQGAIVTHTIEQGLTRDDLLAVCADRSGRLFAATGDFGVDMRAASGWTRVGDARELGSVPVWSCAADSWGTLWLGTGGGLFRARGTQAEAITLPGSRLGATVGSVFAASNGEVWAISEDDVFKLTNGRITRMASIQGAGIESVLGESPDGTLWMAGGRGLFAWRDGTLSLKWSAPTAAYKPLSMLVEKSGTLWIGTAASGLLRYRAGRTALFGRAAGLPDLTVAAVLDDGRGFLWLATHSGLVRVAHARVDDGTGATRLDPTVYTMRDGLRSNYVDERGQPAGAVTPDGHVWIATTRGLAEIDPSRLPAHSQATGIFIDAISVDGRPIAPGEAVPPGRGDLQFRFSAAGRISSPHVRFRYRLEGFDAGWIEAGTAHVATYTNVPPRRYRFVVGAADETPDWGPDEAAALLELTPHWYQTWWFQVLAVGCVIGVAGAAPGLRARRLRRDADALSRVVDARTADLRAEVDERRRAETNLRESESRYRTLAAELEVRVQQRTEALQAEVHEHQMTEARLVIARDAAEAADRAKSAFLAHMSHELRTPLNAVIGYTELLQEEATERGIGGFEHDLTKIRAAGSHLLALVSEVLDLARIESGGTRLARVTFEVTPLVTEVVDSVVSAACRQNNVVRVLVDPGVDRMTADAVRLKQVLLNLVSNACKFTHDGTITIDVRPERDANAAWTVFVVRDTGVGIAAEDLPRLFGEFTQIQSASRPHEGVGLGLAISRRLCALMGGTIDVHSELGKGTTFTVRLPTTLVDGPR